MSQARQDLLGSTSLFVFALGLFLAFKPFARPLLLDPATWDYMSVEIARGLVPYRDVFLHKTPMAALIGAAGARLATLGGLEGVHGAHAVFLLIGAAAPVLLYLLCRPSMGTTGALAAALFMLAADQWVVASIEGVRPKVVATTLGLACLLCANRGHCLSAGILGGLSALCWQPALCFLFGAASRWLPTSAPNRATVPIRLLTGLSLPISATMLWLYSEEALVDFFQQALWFNFDYIAYHATSPPHTFARLLRQLIEWMPVESALLPPVLVVLGLLRPRMPTGLLVATATYTVMIFVSFQAWPDTLLLVPGIAALLAGGLTAAFATPRLFGLGLAAVPVLALLLACLPHEERLTPPIEYTQQRRFIERLASGIGPRDTVIAIGFPELLLHLNRRNGWRWPYMWFGVDRFAAEHSPAGFGSLLAELDEKQPALIALARRWRGSYRRDFEGWACQGYSRESYYVYPHTIRPVQIYRRMPAKALRKRP
ncbi:MAG: hypothetical protein ACE5E4_00675 [Candidatus Binatia bacterium]